MLTPFADGHPLATPIVHPGGHELASLTAPANLPKILVPGGGDGTPMSLRSKVFEFYSGQAPTVTIGHVWSLFSNLDASTSQPF